jgi:type I restriction enzyme S subunit
MPGEGILDLERTSETITDEGLRSCSTNILPVGSVLYSTRATIGKLAIAKVPVATNQGFNNLVAGPDIYNRYLAYALQFFTPDIGCLAGSTTFKEVSRSSLRAFRIPLPPLSEQHRIAKLLDEADRLRRLRREADAKAARILPALFLKMFGDPATNPKGLAKKPLGNLIKVRSGNFLPAKDMAAGGVYPVYGGNGVSGYHDSFMFEERKIVLGRVGAYCGAVHYSAPNSWITDNALYVSEKQEPFEDHYLIAALEQANLNQYAGRAGQPLISGSRIYPVEILVPPDSMQRAFSKSVASLLDLDQSRASASTHLDQLWDVLMSRAFSGQLTAKWREAHMKELLAEMEQQARALNLPVALEVAS